MKTVSLGSLWLWKCAIGLCQFCATRSGSHLNVFHALWALTVIMMGGWAQCQALNIQERKGWGALVQKYCSRVLCLTISWRSSKTLSAFPLVAGTLLEACCWSLPLSEKNGGDCRALVCWRKWAYSLGGSLKRLWILGSLVILASGYILAAMCNISEPIPNQSYETPQRPISSSPTSYCRTSLIKFKFQLRNSFWSYFLLLDFPLLPYSYLRLSGNFDWCHFVDSHFPFQGVPVNLSRTGVWSASRISTWSLGKAPRPPEYNIRVLTHCHAMAIPRNSQEASIGFWFIKEVVYLYVILFFF